MTTNPPCDHSVEIMEKELRGLRRTAGVNGALIASLDGRTIVSELREDTPGAAAAITASSLGLGARLGDLTGEGASLLELQARTTSGYVCIYAIGSNWLLTLLTDLSVNLALLKLDVRDTIGTIEALPESGHSRNKSL